MCMMLASPRSLPWPGAKPLFMGGFCIFGRLNLTTNVYIDGFNLYYGALRNRPYRWLNLERLCQLLLPKNTIGEIKYFTALVSAQTIQTNR
jgi:hypothetical protein